MNSQDKRKFRATVAWKRFREKILEDRGCTCELFGTKLPAKSLDLHHLFPDDYTDLDPKKFRLLSTQGHELIEMMAVKMNSKTVLPNRQLWEVLLDGFLPVSTPKYRINKPVDKLVNI